MEAEALHVRAEQDAANGSPPKVSIGLPVYNGARFLCEAIDSVLAQSYTNFELIISDNCSTDGTDWICQRYQKQDARIRYLRQPANKGAAPNYNLLVSAARGEYFKWLAHDDVLHPENLERGVEVLENQPDVVLCYPKTLIISEAGEPLHGYLDFLDLDDASPAARYRRFHQVFIRRGECNAVFGLIRRSVLLETAQIGPYPSSDLLLLGELVLRGRFVEGSEALFMRRDHSETSIRMNPDPYKRAVWFDVTNRGKPALQNLRWFREYLVAVHKAPIAPSERLGCYWQVLIWGIRNRGRIARDLVRWAWFPGRRGEPSRWGSVR